MLICFAATGRAQDTTSADEQLKRGLEYYNVGNYTEAARWLRMAANQGDVLALYNLGSMYEAGVGMTQDYAEAVRWWHMAAEKRFARAQFNLGIMYCNGRGVGQDYAEALKWFQKAADNGHISGFAAVGEMYAQGIGVARDYAKAAEHYDLAARKSSGDEAKEYAATAAEYRQKAAGEWVEIREVKWATRNVGERGQFVAKPEDYGGYYTWEEAQTACPAGWRTPTKQEFESLRAAYGTWTAVNGVAGSKFGDGNSAIFLPNAGFFFDGSLGDAGAHGYYWSSSQYSPNTSFGFHFFYSKSLSVYLYNFNKYGGFPVRCVQS